MMVLLFVSSHMFQHVVFVDRFVSSHMFHNEAHHGNVWLGGILAEMASLLPMFRRSMVFWDIVAMMVLLFVSSHMFHHVVFVRPIV